MFDIRMCLWGSPTGAGQREAVETPPDAKSHCLPLTQPREGWEYGLSAPPPKHTRAPPVPLSAPLTRREAPLSSLTPRGARVPQREGDPSAENTAQLAHKHPPNPAAHQLHASPGSIYGDNPAPAFLPSPPSRPGASRDL